MSYLDFNVEDVTPLEVRADHPIQHRNLMSPYVWKEAGGYKMLVRSAPETLSETGNTGAIHYGESDDGIYFHVHAKPVIAPDDGELDIGGCEDPTLIRWHDEYVVYYTGVDKTRSSGQMLYASGPRIDRLQKRGVALASSKTAGNTKEATVERTADGHWRLFYEFARDDASLIGLALGDGVAGPWHEQPAPFAPRVHAWDSWHLSTGPLLTSDPDTPVMFYNGATRDGASAGSRSTEIAPRSSTAASSRLLCRPRLRSAATPTLLLHPLALLAIARFRISISRARTRSSFAR